MSELSREHEETRRLLSWYLTGTLEGEELQRVRQHIGACLVCRQELTGLRRQVEFIETYDQPLTQPEQSFARLMRRIKADNNRHRVRRLIAGWVVNIRNRWRGRLVRPTWAYALLLVMTTGVVVLFWSPPQPVTYRTLADAPSSSMKGAASGTLRAVFDGSLNLDDFQKLLHECAVTISAGPNSAGAYTLQAIAGDDGRESALTCLRATPVVRFAEPVMGMRSVD